MLRGSTTVRILSYDDLSNAGCAWSKTRRQVTVAENKTGGPLGVWGKFAAGGGQCLMM